MPNKNTLLHLSNLIKKHCLLLAVVLTLPLVATSAAAQTRDHLTDPESELIRFHQELDKRIEVFIKAIDRRFGIINGVAEPKTKKVSKDEPDWGDAPKGTRAELLGDIAGILDEAITNIDDVSRRDEKNPMISRALRKLSAAATNYATQLTAMLKQSKDGDELSAIERALDEANEIIEVGSKLPPPETQKKKKS
ncbi:MAG TPA: hypothetical protein VN696_03060 [Pyrinomonadaceae bacterium]|nr:hypothetical protein [Pyrinomonadaceae bacterium]